MEFQKIQYYRITLYVCTKKKICVIQCIPMMAIALVQRSRSTIMVFISLFFIIFSHVTFKIFIFVFLSNTVLYIYSLPLHYTNLNFKFSHLVILFKTLRVENWQSIGFDFPHVCN